MLGDTRHTGSCSICFRFWLVVPSLGPKLVALYFVAGKKPLLFGDSAAFRGKLLLDKRASSAGLGGGVSWLTLATFAGVHFCPGVNAGQGEVGMKDKHGVGFPVFLAGPAAWPPDVQAGAGRLQTMDDGWSVLCLYTACLRLKSDEDYGERQRGRGRERGGRERKGRQTERGGGGGGRGQRQTDRHTDTQRDTQTD